MLKNYFLSAARNLGRSKTYSAINVVGLATGLACCLLILQFVTDELSFDRFHPNADRTYRISMDLQFGERTVTTLDVTAGLIADLASESEEMERSVRTSVAQQTSLLINDRTFFETGLRWAGPTFFSVFDFPLLAGDPESVLAQPGTIVFSRSRVDELFGPGENPVGETVLLGLEQSPYTVTGIFADVPSNTHLQFDAVASYESDLPEDRLPTYIQLAQGVVAGNVEKDLLRLTERRGEPGSAFHLTSLPDIYFSDEHGDIGEAGTHHGNRNYVLLFSGIALMVLLIACVNYTNLATARATRRAREIGIRKVAGATRGQLAIQFLSEAIILALVSSGFALGLAELALPGFNAITGKELDIVFVGANSVLPQWFLMALVVGFLAGSYPALVLTSFPTISTLKGRVSGHGSPTLRKGLVVLQFGVSILLVVTTLVMRNQMDFATTKPMGFDAESVVLLQPEGALTENQEAFLSEIRQQPGVISAAFGQIPGVSWLSLARLDGAQEDDPGIRTYIAAVDYDFVPMMGIEVLAGRNLSPEFSTDASSGILINEAAVHSYGWKVDEAPGKHVVMSGTEYTVVGVTRDHHFESIKAAISPLAMRIEPGNMVRNVAVRVRPESIRETIASLNETWQQFIVSKPFTYEFLDDEMAAYYATDRVWSQVIQVASGLAILIAALGLLGLVSLVVTDRTKEVGIRKVLGATLADVVTLFTRDFVILVAIAMLVAGPLAYAVMNKWLAGFAYRVDIGVSVFLIAGGIALAVTLATVGFHAVRAALADPVKSLRYE